MTDKKICPECDDVVDQWSMEIVEQDDGTVHHFDCFGYDCQNCGLRISRSDELSEVDGDFVHIWCRDEAEDEDEDEE